MKMNVFDNTKLKFRRLTDVVDRKRKFASKIETTTLKNC